MDLDFVSIFRIIFDILTFLAAANFKKYYRIFFSCLEVNVNITFEFILCSLYQAHSQGWTITVTTKPFLFYKITQSVDFSVSSWKWWGLHILNTVENTMDILFRQYCIIWRCHILWTEINNTFELKFVSYWNRGFIFSRRK